MSSTLARLEDAVRSATPDVKVDVEITLTIHEDIPAGYVEDKTADDGTFYRKVIDAQSGIVTKSVRIFIPD